MSEQESEYPFLVPAAKVIGALNEVSFETDAITQKLNGFSQQLESLNRNPGSHNIPETERIKTESANDFDSYSGKLEQIAKRFEQAIGEMSESFSAHVKSINTQTEDGRDELAGVKREADGLVATVAPIMVKLKSLRAIVGNMRGESYGRNLNRSALLLTDAVDKITSAYADFETFSLNTLFLATEKDPSNEKE